MAAVQSVPDRMTPMTGAELLPEPADEAPERLTARQAQGRESRDRILDTTEQLIARHGFSATSISMISKASGLPGSSIYWHFSSKEELLVAVVERGANRWLQERPSWDTFEDLDDFLAAIGAGIEPQPQFSQILFQLILESPESAPAEARQRVCDLWCAVRADLEPVMTRYFDLGHGARDRALAKRLASVVMVWFDGVIIAGRVDPDLDLGQLLADLRSSLEAIVRSVPDPVGRPRARRRRH